MNQQANAQPTPNCIFCGERATSELNKGKWCPECRRLIAQSFHETNANMLVLSAAAALGLKGELARALVREANAYLGSHLGIWSGTAYDDRDPPNQEARP